MKAPRDDDNARPTPLDAESTRHHSFAARRRRLGTTADYLDSIRAGTTDLAHHLVVLGIRVGKQHVRSADLARHQDAITLSAIVLAAKHNYGVNRLEGVLLRASEHKLPTDPDNSDNRHSQSGDN